MSSARRGRAAALRYLRAGARRFDAEHHAVKRWPFLGTFRGYALLAGARWEVRSGNGRLVLTQQDPDVLVPMREYGPWITSHPVPLRRRMRAKVVRRGR